MKKIVFVFLALLATIELSAQVDSLARIVVQEQTAADTAEQKSDSTSGANNSAVDKISNENGPPDLSELISISKIFWAIVFLIAGYFLIRLISRILEIFAERSTLYRIRIKSFVPVVKILGWAALVFLIVNGIFHPPASTVLAFSASIGVAVGFASQDILKNIFGGIMILFDRPFKVGDKIEVGSHYGEVVEIGLRLTRIVTPDDSIVSIPNGEVMSHSVSNANSGESNCQVVTEIYLPIDADTTVARGIAIEAAKVSRYVYLNKPIVVIFKNEYEEKTSLLKMKIKAYVLDIRDEFKFKSEVTELVIKKLLEENIISANRE
ncbi:MAG: mechanosensitive ion channel domain-containing protein [Cyclobacteriaceae bacterium]